MRKKASFHLGETTDFLALFERFLPFSVDMVRECDVRVWKWKTAKRNSLLLVTYLCSYQIWSFFWSLFYIFHECETFFWRLIFNLAPTSSLPPRQLKNNVKIVSRFVSFSQWEVNYGPQPSSAKPVAFSLLLIEHPVLFTVRARN